ncbi:hypothetical protein D6C85_09953 [Aureobasidium pullulans]|uniref:Methyltransferase n=1 Tax=Aureobasidium pullulans TaxID=5580 RepID=A0A4S9W430_AURPU|nr:hypothetical protein D6C85_09953 [Aureobasidium pullulans]
MSLEVKFQYIADCPEWAESKPYYISGPLDAAHEFTDLRGREDKLRMEKDGFELVNYPTPVPVSLDYSVQDLTSDYLVATSKWLQERFNAEKVLCYAYRYRKTGSEGEWEGTAHDIGTRVKPDSSTASPHVDQTLDGGLRRAQRHMTDEEVSKYLNGDWRIRIVNIWRPLDHPVEDSPLAFCDYKSIDSSDLIAADRVSEQYAGEVYYLRYNQGQQWHWFSNQTPDEIALFLSYDSHPQGPQFCAHASFKHPDATGDTIKRHSVEVRSIVITRAG